MKSWRWFWVVAIVVAAVGTLAEPGSALACAACYGKSDSPLAAGMNWGIFTLLGFIGSVLGGVAAFFVYIVRRANKAPLLPGPQQDEELAVEVS